MDDQALEDLKKRIASAELTKQRIKNLAEAVERVESGNIAGLQFPLNTDEFEMFYQIGQSKPEDDDRWYRVCWFSKENGLTEEIHAAILNVLRSRLAEAKSEWEAA